MKYFKNNDSGEVFAFDETDSTQLPYMQAKIEEGFEDITETWTPLASETVVQVNPVEKLKEFLSANPDVAAVLNPTPAETPTETPVEVVAEPPAPTEGV